MLAHRGGPNASYRGAFPAIHKDGKYGVVPVFSQIMADVDTAVTVYLKVSPSASFIRKLSSEIGNNGHFFFSFDWIEIIAHSEPGARHFHLSFSAPILPPLTHTHTRDKRQCLTMSPNSQNTAERLPRSKVPLRVRVWR